MKRILIVNNALEAGGAERQLFYLSRNLVKDAYVEFLVLKKTGVFVEKIENLGILVSIIPFDGIWRISRYIRHYAVSNHFDVVLSFLPKCNLSCELANLPYKRFKVFTGARSANPDFLTNKKYRLYYWAHLLADGIIANSQKNKNDILKVNKLISPAKIHVIYNIIIPSDIIPVYREDRKPIKIVVAANFRPAKNLNSLLLAIKELKDKLKNKLVIEWYGMDLGFDFEHGKKFIAKNKISNIIKLYPSSNDILSIYAKTDVVGLFSLFEGFPNSICEAILLGKMFIATPVSDLRELFVESKNILSDGTDKSEIKKALLKLISFKKNEINTIGRENKEKYLSFFLESKIYPQFRQIIGI